MADSSAASLKELIDALKKRLDINSEIFYDETPGVVTIEDNTSRPNLALMIRRALEHIDMFSDTDSGVAGVDEGDFFGVPVTDNGKTTIDLYQKADGKAVQRYENLGQSDAIVSGSVYDSVETGLKSTDDGGIFISPSPEGDLCLYKNDSGTATVLYKIPNADHLDEFYNLVRADNEKQGYAAVGDKNGFARFFFDWDGGFGTTDAYVHPDSIVLRGDGDDFSIQDGNGFIVADWVDGSLRTDLTRSLLNSHENGTIFSIADTNGFIGVALSDDGLAASGLSPAANYTSSSDTESVAYDGATARLYGQSPLPKVIAHRGVHVNGIAPENSLDAYRMAGMIGYKYCETDVQKTKDGVFVILHDASINRTYVNNDLTEISDTVNILDYTFDELRNSYVQASDNPAYRKPIPTLQEFLENCKQWGLHPVTEIKYDSFTEEELHAIDDIHVQIMGNGNYSYTSFYQGEIQILRAYNPYVMMFPIKPYDKGEYAKSIAPAAYYPSKSQVSSEISDDLHMNNTASAAWTVNADTFSTMVHEGLDYTATNDIAPEYPIGSPIKSTHKLSSFTGADVNNGIISLSEGNTISIDFGDDEYDLAGIYVALEVVGNFTVNSNNINNKSFTHDKLQNFYQQTLFHDDTPSFSLTANGDVEIWNVNARIYNFLEESL